MSKKIYRVFMFITVSVLIFFIVAICTEKMKQDGKALELKMAVNMWLETERLDDAEEGSEQDSQEPEEENSIPNLEALKWGDVPQQNVYESYWDFPFLEMEFADDREFEYLQEIYREIPFYGGFPLGDEKKYKICKDKFARLLKNEITVTVPETGEESYLEEFELVIEKYNDKPYDLERYYFYLFDVDGNDAPELCLFDLLSTDIIDSMCIFKYDFDLDKIILWDYFPSHYTLLFGSNSVAGENGNANYFSFYQVDENAEPVFRTGFLWEGSLTNGKLVCMVALPQYIDGAKRDFRIEQMKEKAFYDKETGGCYLRITKEQYEKLFNYYEEAKKKASEGLDKLKKNYWELFE